MAEKQDIEAALLWSLLHDVGHYPLSHMFEDTAEAEKLAGGKRTVPLDDELFCALSPTPSMHPKGITFRPTRTRSPAHSPAKRPRPDCSRTR